jgi:hypothetical protein
MGGGDQSVVRPAWPEVVYRPHHCHTDRESPTQFGMTRSLARYRSAVAAAEAALDKAREAMRSAAKRKGLDTTGIFSETDFVLRSSADRWVFDAERKAEEACWITFKALLASRSGEDYPESSPFGHLARPRRSAQEAPVPTPCEAAAWPKPRLVIDNVPAAETVSALPAEGVDSEFEPQGAA